MVGSGSPAPHFVNNDYAAAEIVSSTAHARREVLDQLRASVSCSTPGRLLASVCAVTPDELRMKALQLLLWGYTGVTPRLCHVRLWYGSVMAMLWLLLRLLRQPGEKKRVCSPCGSSSLRPASELTPCLPWVQPTVWTARQLPLWAAPVIHQASVFLKLPESSTVHSKLRTTALGWLPTMNLG